MSVSEELGARRTVRIPAGTLEYRERGSGPPVVFVHGAATNGDLWRKVAPALADRHRCIAPDLPLGGHSIPLDADPDLSLFGAAGVLAGLLEALELEDATLVGNDTGGAICQALVGRRPERVGRLVLTSCDAWDNYPPKAVAYLKAVVRVPPLLWLVAQSARLRAVQRLPITYGWGTHEPIEPRIMESYLGSLRTNPGVRRDFAALLRGAHAADCVQASESVRGFDRPALVAWAADDRLFPRAHGERLAELLPQGRFALVQRARTFIPEDNPGALVALLRDFLATGQSPSSK